MTSTTNLQNFTHAHLELDLNKILYAPDDNGVIQQEEWRDIPNYENYYQVSSFGRVKSLSREVFNGKGVFIKKDKILIANKDTKGYLNTILLKNKRRKNYGFHQLVAMAFLGHIPNGHTLVVDHKNEIKDDNRVINLRIVTNRYNCSRVKRQTSSKYTGVTFAKHTNRWRSVIKINGKGVHLGYFENEYDAHLAYQNKLNNLSSESTE